MLSTIEAVLRDMHLSTDRDSLRYCISISNGNTVSVSSYLDARRFFQVKVSETLAFADEYTAHLQGWQQYGDIVPKPIGRQVRDGWDVFVAQGVHHKPFVFDSTGRGDKPERVLDDLSRFFRISASAAKSVGATNRHSPFLEMLALHFKPSPLTHIADYWLEQGRFHGVCDLPAIPQHGDFVENNIGYDGKQLVVFDWEDFGKYHLPGLDICSFCFSAAQHINELTTMMISPRLPDKPLGRFVARACGAIAMDPDQFRRLIPLYLLIFLHAKREYSPTVQLRIEAALRQLSATFAL